MWIKDNEPGIYKNTWKFVLYEDFLMQKFGLEPTISYSLAGLTIDVLFQLYDTEYTSA